MPAQTLPTRRLDRRSVRLCIGLTAVVACAASQNEARAQDTHTRGPVYPAHTVLRFNVHGPVCSKTAHPGDRVVADAQVMRTEPGFPPSLPASSTASLVFVRVDSSTRISFLFRVQSLTVGTNTYPMTDMDARPNPEALSNTATLGTCLSISGELSGELSKSLALK
jgi:hypothetical protein